MSIVHADNFSIYGTTTSLLLNGVYAQDNGVTLTTDPDGVSGGHVLRLEGGSQSGEDGIRFVLPSNQDNVGIAQRVWLPVLPGSDIPTAILFQFRDVSNSQMVTITPDTTGRLQVRSGSSTGSIVYTTPTPVITATGWYHIECAVDNSANTVEVRVEGITVISTSVTIASDISQIFTGSRTSVTSAGFAWYCKDLVVWNGAGSYNNDFIGTVLVTTCSPTADVALNWTPSTGSNGYSILDNVPPNDSQFLSAPYDSGTPHYPDPYVATMSDLPVETTSVKAIVTFVRAAKSDGGDGSLQVGIISDGDTALGADRPITIAQTYWRDVFEVDPATSAPWLPQAVNDAELQLNRTT